MAQRITGTQPLAGYPQATRTIQAPAQYTTQAAPRTISGATYTTQAARPATTITSAPGTTIASSPQVIRQGAPIMQSASATTTGRTLAPQSIIGSQTLSAGARQARVISGGQVPTTISSTAAPQFLTQSIAGQRTVLQQIPTAPRIIAAQPASIISPGQPVGGLSQSAYEVKHKDDPQLQNLKELRKTSGLKNVPVNDALQVLKTSAVDGKLTREQFIAAYATLLQQFQVDLPGDDVQKAVFDLFDRDDNNVVDMMELICGASLLCTGSEEDKIHAVFNVFDENGDGVISMDEMFKFLTSVFKVVLTPNVMAVMNSMGVTVESPEDLASVTALECFKTADLNHDGKLSVAEFKNWFFAPRNDPSFLFSPVRKLLQ